MVITYLGNDIFKVQFGETSLAFNPSSLKVSQVNKTPFIITGPGEYEVGGVFIKGFTGNTYTVNLENMNICFLGSENIEEIDEVDILFVSLASIDSSKAYKMAVSIEPKIVIPMQYTEASLKSFLKEAGSHTNPESKLTLKKKDLEGKKVEVMVLESSKE